MATSLEASDEATSSERPGKAHEVELGLPHLFVIVVVSGLLLSGLWGYGSALLSPFLSLGSSSPEYPLVITSAITVDPSTGALQTSFARGSLVGVKIELSYPAEYYYYYYYYAQLPVPYVQFLEHKDPTLLVMSIGIEDRRSDPISPGVTKTLIVGYFIPYGANTGSYEGKILIYSDWPWASGVKLYALPVTVSYTVT